MSFTCKLCNLSFNKQRKLWRHNYSREHIEKINQIEDNIIEITDSIRQKSKDARDAKNNHKKNNQTEKLKRDPALDNKDIRELNRNGFDLNYADGSNPVKCNFDEEKTQIPEIKMNPKQERIIGYLTQNQGKPELTKTFFELLKKLDLPDYKMLGTFIINQEKIIFSEKEKMLKVIELFKRTLIKKKETGENVFNGMQIDDVIQLL